MILCHNYASIATQIICQSLLEVSQHTVTCSATLSVAHDAIHRHVTQVLVAHANGNHLPMASVHNIPYKVFILCYRVCTLCIYLYNCVFLAVIVV